MGFWHRVGEWLSVLIPLTNCVLLLFLATRLRQKQNGFHDSAPSR